MIRDFHLADWFTIANAFCGMAAVLSVMSFLTGAQAQGLLWAAVLIPAAFVFDVFDGRIARWRQTNSALGRELDSLADVVSFGVAPAAMAFGAGLDGVWDCLVLVYFVACGVSRLARYNITAEALSADASGNVTARFRIPDETRLGSHVLEATGWASTRVSNGKFTVVSVTVAGAETIAPLWWVIVLCGALLFGLIVMALYFRHSIARAFHGGADAAGAAAVGSTP